LQQIPVSVIDADSVQVICDKQGGRNAYAPLVQAGFPDSWVVTEVESADESRYRVENLAWPVTVVFRPRADSGSVAVAIASMLAKYLRELSMKQFNDYWATHIPGIAPTAGYPVDAQRFLKEIRPHLESVGITEDRIWRSR
jgi:ribonuclease HII